MSNSELVAEENVRLRGDAIGSTLYSERWVLKLMMRLFKLSVGEEEFNTDLERDLCTLWDMTAEEEVVWFMETHGILGLLLENIKKAEGGRLMEILVGILANLCAFEAIRDVYGCRADLLNTLISLLSCPDALSLIQVIRVINSFAYHVCNSSTSVSKNCTIDDSVELQEEEQVVKEGESGNQDVSKSDQYDSQRAEQESNGSDVYDLTSSPEVKRYKILKYLHLPKVPRENTRLLSCSQGANVQDGSNHPCAGPAEKEFVVPKVEKNLIGYNQSPNTCLEKIEKSFNGGNQPFTSSMEITLQPSCNANSSSCPPTNCTIGDSVELQEEEQDVKEGKSGNQGLSKSDQYDSQRGKQEGDRSDVCDSVNSPEIAKTEHSLQYHQKCNCTICSSPGNSRKHMCDCKTRNQKSVCFTENSKVSTSSLAAKRYKILKCLHTPKVPTENTSLLSCSQDANVPDGNNHLSAGPAEKDFLEPKEKKSLIGCYQSPSTCLEKIENFFNVGNQPFTSSMESTLQPSCKASNSLTENERCEYDDEKIGHFGYSGKCAIWYNTFVDVKTWLPKIIFIMNSSKNIDLLEMSWTLINTLCYVRIDDTILSSAIPGPDAIVGFFESVTECLKQSNIFRDKTCNKMPKIKKYFITWLDILYSFTLHETATKALGLHKGSVISVINMILKHFDLLLPVNDDVLTAFERMMSILHDLLFIGEKGIHLLISTIPNVMRLRAFVKEEICELDHLEEYNARLLIVRVHFIDRYLNHILTWIDTLPDVDKRSQVNVTKICIEEELKSN